MKKTIVAALLAASMSPAMVAASYYVVVPLPGRSAVADNIAVNLNPYVLPSGVAARAYAGFDFNSLLQVQGDPNFQQSSVRWSVVEGAPPAGLSLNSNGKLTGTPAQDGVTKFTVRATYKTKTGERAYQFIVMKVIVELYSGPLTMAVQGLPYKYDFNQKLGVSGDPQFTPSQVTWSVVNGALPDGFQLNGDGTITGVALAAGVSAEGTFNFRLRASYLNKAAEHDYQVMVGPIVVTLGAGAVPSAAVGQVYNSGMGWNLKQNLNITGDVSYAGNGKNVTWSVEDGALPTGLTLNQDGTVTGTPSANGTNPVLVKASYKDKFATQSYTLPLTGGVTQYSGYRAWSDGTYAASCIDYLNGKAGFAYAGATGNGIYRIKPAGTVMDVLCDMTTDGGGWTLLMKQAKGDGVTLQGDTTYWTNGTVLNDTTGNMNLNDGNFVSAAFAALPTSQLKLQASNESTTQKRMNSGSMTAKTAFSDANRTVYSDKIFTWYPSAPNWSIYATTYPNGDTLSAARFGFNFGEIWWMQQPGVIRCAVRWGWAGNQDVSESTPSIQEGSFDACGGLGAYGVAYGGSFMNNNKNAWQPATYYLWGK